MGAGSSAPSVSAMKRERATGIAPVRRVVSEKAMNAMKLCCPMPSGPRNRAAATEVMRK